MSLITIIYIAVVLAGLVLCRREALRAAFTFFAGVILNSLANLIWINFDPWRSALSGVSEELARSVIGFFVAKDVAKFSIVLAIMYATVENVPTFIQFYTVDQKASSILASFETGLTLAGGSIVDFVIICIQPFARLWLHFTLVASAIALLRARSLLFIFIPAMHFGVNFYISNYEAGNFYTIGILLILIVSFLALALVRLASASEWTSLVRGLPRGVSSG
jgi:hypothetical protein